MEKIKIENLIDLKLESSSKILTEDEAKKIFKLFDIPVVEEICAVNSDEIMQACKKINFPIVLKGIVPDISHKTESGLVCVGLNNQDQVDDAVSKMRKSAKNDIKSFLLQPFVQGKREFIAGMFKDPEFGAVIMFGTGGIFTEALKDISFKIAPLDDLDIDDMFEQLSSKKLLYDFRGEKPVNKKTIKTILKALSDIAKHPNISQIDINPLIIQPDGSPVAVDGLIVLEKEIKKSKNIDLNLDLKTLTSCFYPKSIAFIGASATPGKWGHMLLTNTLSRDYKGKVYLVNPKGRKIAGRYVYKSITEIENNVDLAVVTIPAHKVIDLIPDLKKKHVQGLLLITSGFKEIGKKGANLEKKLVQKAYEAGILILGPNTMGICNPHINFYCCAANAYPMPGSTALVCQSGNMGTQLLAFAEQQDIGIRAFSGSGNEAMVTIEDYMEAFEIDKLTKTIVLYIESVKNGARFFKSAVKLSKKKPVIVLKGGRTDMGKKAAASHTGSMASDIKVFDAVCRQSGIIQVKQPVELLDLSVVFSSLPLPKGNKVAIMTLGGGWGVITTDLCVEYGLEIPKLPQTLIKKFNNILPAFWSHGNPVDIVGEADPDIPNTCLEELLKWDGCDGIIHLGIHGRRVLANNMIRSACIADPDMDDKKAQFFKDLVLQHENDYIENIVKLTQKYEKPILGVSLLGDEISKTIYRIKGYEYKSVFFPSPERAVKALWGMCRYNEWRKSRT